MVHVYTINWFKKVQNINYCSHAAQQLFILSYSDAVSFRDIRSHLGTIPLIVTFQCPPPFIMEYLC
jgi:hypothetical protein